MIANFPTFCRIGQPIHLLTTSFAIRKRIPYNILRLWSLRVHRDSITAAASAFVLYSHQVANHSSRLPVPSSDTSFHSVTGTSPMHVKSITTAIADHLGSASSSRHVTKWDLYIAFINRLATFLSMSSYYILITLQSSLLARLNDLAVRVQFWANIRIGLSSGSTVYVYVRTLAFGEVRYWKHLRLKAWFCEENVVRSNQQA